MSLEWENLKDELHPWLGEAITSLGLPCMTPVQASTIPLFSGNKDVVVQSVTGSGKTLAFIIPVLHHVSRILYGLPSSDVEPTRLRKGCMIGVIISPTRELAHQIKAVLDQVLAFLPQELPAINTQLVVGSLGNVREDVDLFLTGKTHIVVGTPGRLLDFMSHPKVVTSLVEIAVLDEADRLLDSSFEAEVLSILRQLPKQRRTGLFSATLSASGDRIFKTGMSNPVKVAVQSKLSLAVAPSALTIKYLVVKPDQKLTTFIKLIQEYNFKKAIVYFPTCISVKHFYELLLLLETDPTDPIKFYSLYGQLSTTARLRTLKAFTDGDADVLKHVLMTTDVAARGIDVADVDLVVQVDPPNDPDVFLHRAGRTGRANKAGNAIVLLNDDCNEINYIDFMEVKGVLMKELVVEADSAFHEAFYNKVRQFMLADRLRHETAVKAYVAFVRSYSKHLAKSIFRLQSLDYLGVASMYGLLRLPKMPETRFIPDDAMPEDGWLTESPIDMDNYAYADATKEKARQMNLEAEKEKKIDEAKKRKRLAKKNEAWSSRTETKEAKSDRKQRLQKKREEAEKRLLEESSDEEDVTVDWKDIVRQNKKQKLSTGVQGVFEGL